MRQGYFAAAALLLAISATPQHAFAYSQCVLISGTADGIVKENAVAGSRDALKEAIDSWKSEHGVSSAVITAAKARPKPYWRDQVSSDLYYKPDVVDQSAYTVCWEGVVSPVVCTSGAKLCH